MRQLASKVGAHSSQVKDIVAWGNHSSIQYPDVFNAAVNGTQASKLVDENWLVNDFIPTVQKRGAEIDHMRSWVLGTAVGEVVTMGVPSDGSYGIAEGVIFGYPCTCKDGEYSVVKNYTISEFSRKYIDITYQELCKERAAIQHLLG
jgi:malate dehydrogenase